MELTDEQKAEAQAEIKSAYDAATTFAEQYVKHIEASDPTGPEFSYDERSELRGLIVTAFLAGTNYITRRIALRIIEKAQEAFPVDPKEIN